MVAQRDRLLRRLQRLQQGQAARPAPERRPFRTEGADPSQPFHSQRTFLEVLLQQFGPVGVVERRAGSVSDGQESVAGASGSFAIARQTVPGTVQSAPLA